MEYYVPNNKYNIEEGKEQGTPSSSWLISVFLLQDSPNKTYPHLYWMEYKYKI